MDGHVLDEKFGRRRGMAIQRKGRQPLFDARYSLTRRRASFGSRLAGASSLVFCEGGEVFSPELKADEKFARCLPRLSLERQRTLAPGAAFDGGISEEPPPPMLVRDETPPDIVEQPPKAAQSNIKRNARPIMTPSHTGIQCRISVTSRLIIFAASRLDLDSVKMMKISLK